jgi:hypothetical protein
MERAAHFERADALEVLAFEEEANLWLCGVVALPWCAL